MINNADEIIEGLRRDMNFRSVPADTADDSTLVDLTSNDYLGLAARSDLQSLFMADEARRSIPMTSSASRLLAARQREYAALESLLEQLYDRPVLTFNSGYHANVGLVSAFAPRGTTVIADRLVHASIIDGIKLGGARLYRFRHNDMAHLRRLAAEAASRGEQPLIIVESVYSMDGDRADIDAVAAIRRATPGARLYVDEAHAFGVLGPQGLGLSRASAAYADVDILIGTFGKALAGEGAFAAFSSSALRHLAVNTARSFIFSTAIPPMSAAWTRFMVETMISMDAERSHLQALARRLYDGVAPLFPSPALAGPGHILPLVTGDARRALDMSAALRTLGFKVLPIRRPTVPPGGERLRVSLSAALGTADVDRFINALNTLR